MHYAPPDSCFEGLEGWTFSPHYVDVDGLRVAYVDEGPRDGEVVLCLHGEPSWSYLYRHMIPELVAAGPAGRCSRPWSASAAATSRPLRTDYNLRAPRRMDAGRVARPGRLGTHGYHACRPGLGRADRIAPGGRTSGRLCPASLRPTPSWPTGDRPGNDAFMAWQNFSQSVAEFPVGFIVNSGCTTDLSDAVRAGYDAPFPRGAVQGGSPPVSPCSCRPRPMTRPPQRTGRRGRCSPDGRSLGCAPSATAIRSRLALTGRCSKRVPGTKGMPHTTIGGAGGHFLQEDRGPELAKAIAGFVAATPL